MVLQEQPRLPVRIGRQLPAVVLAGGALLVLLSAAPPLPPVRSQPPLATGSAAPRRIRW